MAEDFYFAHPPEQIGSIIAATTTLQKHRVWLKHLSPLGYPFRHSLGYLGEKGVACFECEHNPRNLIRRELLIFSEAANLFTKRSGSANFEFYWKDPLDRVLFRVADVKLLSLLKAAEAAWTQRLLNSASDTIERGGSVNFPLLGQGVLRLGPSSINWGPSLLKSTHFKFFCRDHTFFQLYPSYAGEQAGVESIKASVETVGNLETLTQLLIHAYGIPIQDWPTEQHTASN